MPKYSPPEDVLWKLLSHEKRQKPLQTTQKENYPWASLLEFVITTTKTDFDNGQFQSTSTMYSFKKKLRETGYQEGELFDPEEKQCELTKQDKANQKTVDSKLLPKTGARPSCSTTCTALRTKLILTSWSSESFAEF